MDTGFSLVWLVLAFLAGLPVLGVWWAWRQRVRRAERRKRGIPGHAMVLVLGDVGRSPRMQYHALSLAACDQEFAGGVTVVGYLESDAPALRAHPRIRLVGIPEFTWWRRPRSKLLFPPFALAKVGYQVFQLFRVLLLSSSERSPGHSGMSGDDSRGSLGSVSDLDLLMVQNPPGLPTLFPAWVACRLTGARLLVDWHNFGYTILGLSLGPRHPLVRLSHAWERFWAGRADLHLCVTAAMRGWLARHWGVRGAEVLYDRPPTKFRRLGPAEKHAFLERICKVLPAEQERDEDSKEDGTAGDAQPPNDDFLWLEGGNEFTHIPQAHPSGVANDALPQPRPGRPALLVSSTSYTPDEDFRILLKGLELYAKARQEPKVGDRLPPLVVVVTGKGPMKQDFLAQLRALPLAPLGVRVRTMWLAEADYPLLLGAADLGVSLHTSSSGLDLPMKVVDMFGCRLPAVAAGFACVGELVRAGVNGEVFDGPEELARCLVEILGERGDDPADQDDARRVSGDDEHPSRNAPRPMVDVDRNPRLKAYREQLREFQQLRWDESWNQVVRPLLLPPAAASSER